MAAKGLGLEQGALQCAHGADNHMIAGSITMIVKGGVTILSLYLHDSQGASEENIAILEAAATFLATIHGPWIICADFNMCPRTLEQTGWVDLVNGVVHATTEPTCGTNRYDYFIVDKGLSRAVGGVQRITDAGTHPHLPVRLLVRGSECRRLPCARDAASRTHDEGG